MLGPKQLPLLWSQSPSKILQLWHRVPQVDLNHKELRPSSRNSGFGVRAIRILRPQTMTSWNIRFCMLFEFVWVASLHVFASCVCLLCFCVASFYCLPRVFACDVCVAGLHLFALWPCLWLVFLSG